MHARLLERGGGVPDIVCGSLCVLCPLFMDYRLGALSN